MGNKLVLIKRSNNTPQSAMSTKKIITETTNMFSGVEITNPLPSSETVDSNSLTAELKSNEIANEASPAQSSLILNSENKSLTSSMKLNEKAAEKWQPQYAHMIRPDARLDNLRRFHNIEQSPYVLPADVEEQDRLEIQHLVLTHCFGRLFHMPIEDIITKPGARILDVGCGPGSWARDFATAYPLCEVHAVDMAKTLFNGAETLPNIFFAEGNLLDGLPFPDNHFDAVFQRYLMLGIPKDKWDFTISELLRITKPGGFVECIEPNTKIEQVGPNGQKLVDGAYQAYVLRGLDADIYFNLPDRIKKSGLNVESQNFASLPIGWGGKVGELNSLNLKMAGESLKPFLMKVFDLTGQEFDKMISDGVEEHKTYKS
ncbi:hypothetical protein HK096_010841, partial [Nowakowskiella sp. JEL0078]